MYIVLEVQKLDATTLVILPANTYNTMEEADSKFYAILSAAAVSSVPIHSAIILNEEGSPIRYESYRHMAQ